MALKIRFGWRFMRLKGFTMIIRNVMFGRKNTNQVESPVAVGKPNTGTDPNALNSLVKGTIIEGTIRAESDIRIDGTIKGLLICAAKMIIGPSGVIDGEVRCTNAVIEGKFTGKLYVVDLLSVKETAEVVGDVRTTKLLVQPGAIFNVNCVTNQEATPIDITPSLNNETK